MNDLVHQPFEGADEQLGRSLKAKRYVKNNAGTFPITGILGKYQPW